MKFLITESCLHSEGQHAEAGTVIDVLPSEAAKLQQAGRGYPAPAEPEPAAEPEKPAKSKK